jgi:hypothetical protein
MKSAHRHELETNTLAHRLQGYIERYRPYASRIVGGLIALFLVILIVSYISGLSSSKQSQAWDTFNLSLAANPPDLKLIHQTAQDYPGTSMQQLADVTWADSQVYVASRAYLTNRKASTEALDKAVSVYQGIVQSSKDEHLVNRVHLGLARAYEMQNKLDEAQSEYRKVKGAYEQFAQKEAERLAKPEAKDTYAWLASAPIPERKQAAPPASPGQGQELSPGDISLPGATSPGKTEGPSASADPFDNIMKSLQTGKIGEKETKSEPPAPNGTGAKSSDAKSSGAAPPTDSKKGAAPTDTKTETNKTETKSPATTSKDDKAAK